LNGWNELERIILEEVMGFSEKYDEKLHAYA